MMTDQAMALVQKLRDTLAMYPDSALFESERALVVVGDALAAAERERDGFRLACDQQADVLRTLRGLLQVEGDDASLVEQARRLDEFIHYLPHVSELLAAIAGKHPQMKLVRHRETMDWWWQCGDVMGEDGHAGPLAAFADWKHWQAGVDGGDV